MVSYGKGDDYDGYWGVNLSIFSRNPSKLPNAVLSHFRLPPTIVVGRYSTNNSKHSP